MNTAFNEFPIIFCLGKEYYGIQPKKNGQIYIQRRYVFNAPDNAMELREEIIVALCDKIMGP